jgi:hypothetical protein
VRWARWTNAEGPTDYRFLSPLLRRVVDDLCLRRGSELIEISDVLPLDAPPDCQETERGPRIREAALAARGAFSVLFVHSDGAGDAERARAHLVAPASEEIAAHFKEGEVGVVAVVPVRETEAWALADGDALRGAFGTTLDDDALGLPGNPREVESIRDPKQALEQAFLRVVGKPRARRKAAHHLEAISVRIRLEQLRRVPAFRRLEEDLGTSLVELGYLSQEGRGTR